jgi:hypothetical protein
MLSTSASHHLQRKPSLQSFKNHAPRFTLDFTCTILLIGLHVTGITPFNQIPRLLVGQDVHVSDKVLLLLRD